MFDFYVFCFLFLFLFLRCCFCFYFVLFLFFLNSRVTPLSFKSYIQNSYSKYTVSTLFDWIHFQNIGGGGGWGGGGAELFTCPYPLTVETRP